MIEKTTFSSSTYMFHFSGYGHSTPSTVGGKSFCMLYALAGIPLGLVMFQSVGERLNTFVAFMMRRVKVFFCSTKTSEISQTHLILVASNIGVVVITLGAYAFHQYEGWTYFDSLYYCFITLTTIGFGDYVALQKNKALQQNPRYVAFSLIFILFGLTVISAAMNLLVLRFLTMNTEDERRDEVEAKIAAQGNVHLEGDIITANGSLHSGSFGSIPERITRQTTRDDDDLSVCSCSCYQLPHRHLAGDHDVPGSYHYSARLAPTTVAHLTGEEPSSIYLEGMRHHETEPDLGIDEYPSFVRRRRISV